MSEEERNTLTKISDEIEKLKKRIDNDNDAIKKINELLEKADNKLKEEPENYDRWMDIIENLEDSLAERRRILQGRTVNLQKLQKEYQKLLLGLTSSEPFSLPEILMSEKELELIENRKVKDIQLALNILETPAEKWGEVSLGEISQIIIRMKQPEEKSTIQTQYKEEEIGAKSEEEIENTIKSNPVYLQLRNLLISGLNKVWDNKPGALTSQEKAIILKAHQHLKDKRNKNYKEDRLFRVISAAFRIIFQKNKPS